MFMAHFIAKVKSEPFCSFTIFKPISAHILDLVCHSLKDIRDLKEVTKCIKPSIASKQVSFILKKDFVCNLSFREA